MATTAKTVASLPLYTVVALFGLLTEVFMRLVGNVAGERCARAGRSVVPQTFVVDVSMVTHLVSCTLFHARTCNLDQCVDGVVLQHSCH